MTHRLPELYTDPDRFAPPRENETATFQAFGKLMVNLVCQPSATLQLESLRGNYDSPDSEPQPHH